MWYGGFGITPRGFKLWGKFRERPGSSTAFAIAMQCPEIDLFWNPKIKEETKNKQHLEELRRPSAVASRNLDLQLSHTPQINTKSLSASQRCQCKQLPFLSNAMAGLSRAVCIVALVALAQQLPSALGQTAPPLPPYLQTVGTCDEVVYCSIDTLAACQRAANTLMIYNSDINTISDNETPNLIDDTTQVKGCSTNPCA